jgi:hypothetical protein
MQNMQKKKFAASRKFREAETHSLGVHFLLFIAFLNDKFLHRP